MATFAVWLMPLQKDLPHVRTLDAAAQPGDDLVRDGAGGQGPVLGRRLTVGAGPEDRDDVATGRRGVAEVDHELVHADHADLTRPATGDADLGPVGRRAQDALAITDRDEAERRVLLRRPRVAVRHAGAGGHPLDRREARPEGHDGGQLRSGR